MDEKPQVRIDRQNSKLVDRSMVALVIVGLAVNLCASRLVLALGIPLFLDSIGTIGAAVLGGILPGIIVGFFTNLINGFSDPITMYYGVLSVFMAVAAAHMSKHRVFASFGKTMLAMLTFAFIGGALGSCLTWLLYGFSFGNGISAPLANVLNSRIGFSEFAAQFSADMLIDIADKFITVMIIFFTLKLLPDRILNRTYQGCFYAEGGEELALAERTKPKQYRKRSLKTKVLVLIVGMAIIIGVSSIAISYIIYSTEMTERFIETSKTAVAMMSDMVNGDDVDAYLQSGGTGEQYETTEARLRRVYDSIPDIQYLYVYKIAPDGCHVVFDMDTPDLPGEECGTLVPFDVSFEPYLDRLFAGERIEPIISNDTYGHLLTVYEPILDSSGVCRAYACVDVSMDDIATDRSVFIIKLLSLLFGTSIFVLVFAVWYAERRMVEPINAMTRAADEFAFDSDENRVASIYGIAALDISTGDEIETLYHALSKTVIDITGYITLVKEKAETIAKMQNNMILSFANMVENRDENTGEHIKRTAQYVGVIARELENEGKFPERLGDTGVDNMVRSAPLHDIGKIKISDTILNKPGKLTEDEFAQMKTHTTEGRNILRGAMDNMDEGEGYLDTAMDMAAYHHEWWDGSGYPEGVSGGEIPLCARIMAVADVFDALISKRSYKEPMSLDRAKAIIIEESGTHFDPDVVNAFIRAWDKIVKVSGK